jgi:hypothetical protein
MSFTHLAHDKCAYKHRLYEGAGAAAYVMDTTAKTHCRACFVPSPGVRMQRSGVATCCEKDLIDVSSELLGITRTKSRCPSNQITKRNQTTCTADAKDECNGLDPENSRLSNPPCTLRGRGWNRWEYPCHNPQHHLEPKFATNINNRLLVKDAHRPCLPTSAFH